MPELYQRMEHLLSKATALIVAVTMVFALFGCANQESGGTAGTGSASGTPLKVGIVFDSGGRGDKSFNDSAWAGVQRAETELGIETMPIESASEKDYETNLSAAADRGCDLVIAVGINMQTALERVAPNYPNTKFAIVDAVVDLPNVSSLLFHEEEGSFLVGYLAGRMSQTGKIGFVGGQRIALIEKFQYAYWAGAKYANPGIELMPAKYTGDWNNVDNAKVTADLLFNTGADVVYHAAGRAGLGVIRSAKENGKWAIGVDSDQDYLEPGSVLTSMVKRVDVAVFNTITDVQNGAFAGGSSTAYGLEEDGVGISELTYTRDTIGEEILAELETIRQRIIDGEMTVPTNQQEFERF